MNQKRRHQNQGNRGYVITHAVTILFLILSMICPLVVAAADEECDLTVGPFNSPADNLCVSSFELEKNYVIDGKKDLGEWQSSPTGTYYYDHNEYAGAGTSAQVLVSHKKRADGKDDLFLFFEVHGDAVETAYDEIRIGLNPGTNPGDSTLLKIHPWNGGMQVEAFNYDTAQSKWISASHAWLPASNMAVFSDPLNALWSFEIKIPLDQIPAHPITTNDFRLYLELHSAFGDTTPPTTVTYPWPPHGVSSSDHEFVCVNPQRWHPMSFGTECFPDLNIANGLYSCEAIYLLRNGAKSNQIGVNEMNEFHADVTNPDLAKNAAGVQVYMTLLQLGISTAPIAMNYSKDDVNIKNWFEQKYGTWMLATDQLDSGTPKPSATFSVNRGTTNTDARFNWRPVDETRFGSAAGMVGTHKCTGAFVDYKDDPNMANNLSFCNTDIVECPTGEQCVKSFSAGEYFAKNNFGDADVRQKLLVKVINEPYKGWLEETKFAIAGPGVEVINSREYTVPVPRKGNKILNMVATIKDFKMPEATGPVILSDGRVLNSDGTIRMPDGTIMNTGKLPVIKSDGTVVYPGGIEKAPGGTLKNPNGTIINPGRPEVRMDATLIYPNGTAVYPAGTNLNKSYARGTFPASGLSWQQARNERIKRIFGNRPIIVVEGYVPAGYKIGAKGEKVNLYHTTNYVAYVINSKRGATPGPTPNCCSPAKSQATGFSSLLLMAGIIVLKKKTDKKRKGE